MSPDANKDEVGADTTATHVPDDPDAPASRLHKDHTAGSDSNPEAVISDDTPASDLEYERLRKMESIVAVVLRGGVFTSAAIVIAGTLITLLDKTTYHYSVVALHGIRAGHLKLAGAPYPHTLGDVIAGVRSLNGPAVIMLGVLVLIATPVLRVAVSLITFAHQRNRDFVIITAIVLTILTTSFLLGRASGA